MSRESRFVIPEDEKDIARGGQGAYDSGIPDDIGVDNGDIDGDYYEGEGDGDEEEELVDKMGNTIVRSGRSGRESSEIEEDGDSQDDRNEDSSSSDIIIAPKK